MSVVSKNRYTLLTKLRLQSYKHKQTITLKDWMFSLALHRHQVLELKAHCSERQRAWAGPRTACVQSREGADGRSGPSAVKETKTGRLTDRLILGKRENESKRTLFLESTV